MQYWWYMFYMGLTIKILQLMTLKYTLNDETLKEVFGIEEM